jgi:hypothetical protein
MLVYYTNKILVKIPNMKLHENQSSWSCAVLWRQTGTHDEAIGCCFTTVP